MKRIPRMIPGAVAGVDQVVSGLTNIIAVIAVASAVPATEFGLFSVAFTAFTFLLACSRGYYGLTILTLSKTDPSELKSYTKQFALQIIRASLLVILFILGTGLLTQKLSGLVVGYSSVIVVVALASPIILVQDLLRYYSVRSGQPYIALVSDIMWLFMLLITWLIRNVVTIDLFLWMWFSSSFVSTGYILIAIKPWNWRVVDATKRHDIRARLSFASASGLSALVSLAVSIMVSAFFGAALAGALRGASTLLAPLNSLIAVLDYTLVAQIKDSVRQSRQKLMKHSMIFAVATWSVWGVIIWLFGGELGHYLLGDTWGLTSQILPITFLEYGFLVIVGVLLLPAKADGKGALVLMPKLVTSVIILTSIAVLGYLGAHFIAVPTSLAVAAAIGFAINYILYRRMRRLPPV